MISKRSKMYLCGVLLSLGFTTNLAFASPPDVGNCVPEQPCQVPEPSSLAILALGIVGLMLHNRKKK